MTRSAILPAGHRSRGFTIIELIMVVTIMLILIAVSLPVADTAMASMRIAGDARSLATQLQLAKLEAANQFTHVRLQINCNGSTTYCLQVLNGTNWVTDPGTQYLSAGVSFGTGNAAAPAGTQTTLAQTSIVEFNSRGIPITSSGCTEPCGTPTSQDTVYLTHQNGAVYAVSVSAAGQIKTWQYINSGWSAL
ncbi:MAG: GspH/FimT family pseudopilin [Acidobacteria bacterium]|nr:GspH/FimT family pseudopilin [Acidobacteriota bacterium]